MLIRREVPGDEPAIRAVIAAAFRGVAHSAPPVSPGGDPGEVSLVSWLRDDAAWIPELSLAAVEGDVIVGHVACTRASVGGGPVLGLGPLSVVPQRQRSGVGTALMHAVLGAADGLGEPLVGLVGDRAYYRRFGFVAGESIGVTSPDPTWGEAFQVRTLAGYDGRTGPFRFAAPFQRL